jgi:hypothetical protein
MAEMREAMGKARGSYKKLHHIEIEPVKGPKGGHMVTHHYGGMEHQPDRHMFDKKGYAADGGHMMEHLYSHLKVAKPEAMAEEHAGPDTKEQAAGEPASADVNA